MTGSQLLTNVEAKVFAFIKSIAFQSEIVGSRFLKHLLLSGAAKLINQIVASCLI